METYKELKVKKTFLLGDLHLGIKNNSSSWMKIQEDFLFNTFIEQCLDNGLNKDTDILILEGDVFHNRMTLDIVILQSASRIFENFCAHFKKIYVIAGNHDVYYKDNNSVTSLHTLRDLIEINPNNRGKLVVLTDPAILTINKHKYLMLPWEHDNKILSETIKNNEDTCDYIICHADIKGAKFNRFVKVETGLDSKNLSKFKKIYAGHIHIRQNMTKAGAQVSYTGTPYHMDKGDIGNKKGFDILSYENDEIVETFVPNLVSPCYVKTNIYILLDLTLDEIKNIVNKNYVDISVDSKIADRFNASTFLDLLGDTGSRTIEFTNYSSDSELRVNDLAQNISDDDLTIDKIFEVYCDQKSYDKLQRQKISEQFRAYIKDIRNAQKSEL